MSESGQTVQVERITQCESCGLPLPLRLPGAEETGRQWICSGCNTSYEALLDRSCPAEVHRNVRPSALQFNASTPRDATQELAKFVAQLAAREHCDERRETRRHEFVTPTLAMPVDDQFRAQGETLVVLTRDISTNGASLIHTEQLNANYVALQLTSPGGPALQVVMRVVRCRPLGPYFEVAGPFVTRLGG